MQPAAVASGDRRTPRARTLAAALALAAAGLVGGSGPDLARASCGATDFPFEFDFDAYVDSADSAGFTVDRLRVELPTSSTLLPWDPDRYELEIDRSAIEPGAYVRVKGSLRPDGTVLAQSVFGAEPEFENSDGINLVSGVLDAIGETGMTVDGHDYAFLQEPDRGVVFQMTFGYHWLPIEEVRVGDAVAFHLDEDEDSGDIVASTVLVRPAGDGAELGGRVTANTLEEGGSFFGHDGTYFEVEGVRVFFPQNEDQAVRAIAREHPDDGGMLELLAEGDGVRLTGWYRDGVLFVEDLFADGNSELRVRPARAVVSEGLVTMADGEFLEVNGVSFRLPVRRGARRAAEAVQVGERVRLRARVPAEGEEPVARIVRRLRRR